MPEGKLAIGSTKHNLNIMANTNRRSFLKRALAAAGVVIAIPALANKKEGALETPPAFDGAYLRANSVRVHQETDLGESGSLTMGNELQYHYYWNKDHTVLDFYGNHFDGNMFSIPDGAIVNFHPFHNGKGSSVLNVDGFRYNFSVYGPNDGYCFSNIKHIY
jgi:hypothetical protein